MKTLFSLRYSALVPFLAVAMIAGCLRQESGIDERHILGVAVIPPTEYTEIEQGDESTNDDFTVDEFEFVDYVGYRFAVVYGHLAEATFVLNQGYRGDHDYYQFISGVDGDISFDLTWADEEANFDLFVYDATGAELGAANASSGFEHLDLTVAEEDELYVLVVGKSMPDEYDGEYTMSMRALDPIDAGDMLLGAYLNSDTGNLGDPVSGTSITAWNVDQEFFRYWATFDMYFVRQVDVVADVFITPEMEDGKDNNCDGVTDRGDADVDADGDGAMISDGDCDDTNPLIRPGFADILGNGIDDDCDGWADNGLDGIDDDGDGMSEFEGDCNDTDPQIYRTLTGEDEMDGIPFPDGKDNNCDGEIDNGAAGDDDDDSAAAVDWPDDNDSDGYTIDDGDCNDADPTIHPCADNDWCLDYRDGKDNDCDADAGALNKDAFDENFEYICPDGGACDITYKQWDDELMTWLDVAEMVLADDMETDDDGDGYAENWGDCNDTDDSVYPGNYELETYFDVDNDIDKVYIFAGTFSSLNATGVASGDIVMSDTQPLDLSEVPDTVTWSMDQDWLDAGGMLVPEGLPEIVIDTVMPPLFGIRCEDEEPNDCDGSVSAFDECAQTSCEGIVSVGGLVDKITGTFETIVQDTWDGDNDTYSIMVNEEGYLNGSLDWETESGDMDWYLYCYYGDDFNPWNWYVLMSGTTDLTKPEDGVSIVPLPAGTQCYAWLVGYAGPNGENYTLRLWMSPADE